MEQQVVAAVQAAYSSGAHYNAAASQWLLEFQPSPQAWQVCTQLLLNGPGMPLEVQIFAAQTLSHKVRRQLEGLSVADTRELWEGLVACLAAASATAAPMVVRSQLCVALASLVVQRPPHPTPLQALGDRLPLVDTALLLGTVAEESKERFYFAATPRDRPHQKVGDMGQEVVTWLAASARAADSPPAAAALLDCFAKWVAADCLQGAESQPQACQMVELTFQAVEHPDSGLARSARNAAEEVLAFCPDGGMKDGLLAACLPYADRAVQSAAAAPLRLETYCSLFSTLCINNLPVWASNTEKGSAMREGLLKLVSLPWVTLDEREEMATVSALEAWTLCADYVIDCTDEITQLRPVFERFLTAVLPLISASRLVGGEEGMAEMAESGCLEALFESGRALGFERYVGCIHGASVSGRCSLEGAIAALSGEGLHRDLSPVTCNQMLGIFEAASKSPDILAYPAKLRFVIRALAGNLETVMGCLGTSESQTSVEGVVEWVRGLAVKGLLTSGSRLEGATLLNRCLAQTAQHGVPLPPDFLGQVVQLLQGTEDSQVEAELVQAVARGLKEEPPARIKEILDGLLPGLLEALGGLGGVPLGRSHLPRASQLLNRLQIVLSMASENVGFEAVGEACVEVLGRVWASLTPALGVPEAGSLRSAVGECCLAGMQCSREVAVAVAALCCPMTAHLVDLDHGYRFVEIAAEAVELLTPPPGTETFPYALTPEAVGQAVHAAAASRRLQRLCGHKSGDEDPEEAEAVLGAIKRVAAATHSPAAACQPVEEFLVRGVEVAVACIPCSHRAVALAASSCMTALLDRTNVEHSQGRGTLLGQVVALGTEIVAALLLALKGPSALVRVHRAVCILGGLIRLPGQDPSLACTWLQSALTAIGTPQHEAESVASSWVPALASGASGPPLDSVNSFAGTRSGQQLKRQVRAFAERHSKAAL